MAMEISGNYSSYAMQGLTGSSTAECGKRQEKKEAWEATGERQNQSLAEYMSKLAKLVSGMECRVGDSLSPAKKGKTLTINPKLLEEMQSDPEREKEVKELIKGINAITKFMDGIDKAAGRRIIYRHSYIDEDGKYRQISCVRNDFMLHLSDKLREERRKNSEKLMEQTKERVKKKREELEKKQGWTKGVTPSAGFTGGIRKSAGKKVKYCHSYIDENGKYHEITYDKNDDMINMSEKLREERRKNSEKLIERTKEKAVKKKEELDEVLEEKEKTEAEEQSKEEKAEQAYKKMEQLLEQKVSASKDGMIYLSDNELRMMLEALKEEKNATGKRLQIGTRMDVLV